MRCNYCRCEEADVVAEYTRFEKNNILQCRSCGLVYLETSAETQTIKSFYSSEYRRLPSLPVLSPEEHFFDKVTQNDTDNQIQFISEYMNTRDNSFLEIGSASGSLLEKLRASGCKEAVGIELDEYFAQYAREKGFRVFTCPIEELNIEAKFDAIVSFHTMEHVYDPMAVIKAIYAALKPKGYFLGEVPNQNDWRIQIFNDEIVKRFHYDPNHLYYFSPVTLTNYLKAGGFDNIRLQTVERYNSLVQLRNILCGHNSKKNIDETLREYIFPQRDEDEVRLSDANDPVSKKFNRIFEKGVDSELMGNCLRWVAIRHQ